MDTITRTQWNNTHRDFRTGDPRRGTAKVVRWTDQGTALVPVTVVPD